MTLPEISELLRSMPAGYTQHYLERKLDELCTLARHEGFVIHVESRSLTPLAMGHSVMVGHVRRARGHY